MTWMLQATEDGDWRKPVATQIPLKQEPSEPQGFIKPNGVGIPALQDGWGKALVLSYFHLHVIFLRTYLPHITTTPLAIGNNLMYI